MFLESIQKLKQTSGLIVAILLFMSLFTGWACKKGTVIEEIGGYTITTADFEEHYSSYVEQLSRLANAKKSTFAKYACNPPTPRSQPRLYQIFGQLKPEENYQHYRDMRMVEQVANRKGFKDRPVIKKIIDYVVLDTISRLYLQERMDERIKITKEDKEKECQRLRSSDKRINALTYEDCLDYSEAVLKQKIIQKEYKGLIDDIKEEVTVTKNNQFDKDKYLSGQVKLYNTLKEKGKCLDLDKPSDSDKKEEKKDK